MMDLSKGPDRLAMEVLAEVPGQVISYFKSKGESFQWKNPDFLFQES